MTRTDITQISPFYEVVRQPLYADLNGQKIRSNKDALINPELNLIVGEVGKNYKLVTNNEVANVMDEALADIKTYDVKDHLDGTTGRWAREIILDDENYMFNIKGNDECKVKVDIFNGYTGTKSVGFQVSAYRLVCSNGLMGWQKQLSVSIPHIREGIVEEIRDKFNETVDKFWNKTRIWEAWADQDFTQDDFNNFINTRDYLSDKMKDNIKGYYVPLMEEYKEEETKWGAYNVLTAMATHHTQARNGSHLFSNAYKRIQKIINDFESYVPESGQEALTE